MHYMPLAELLTPLETIVLAEYLKKKISEGDVDFPDILQGVSARLSKILDSACLAQQQLLSEVSFTCS